MTKSCVSVCPYFRRRGRKYGHGEHCTWKSLLMNQYGEICWKLIWIIIILDIVRQEKGSKMRYIS